ncbi:hypothetical protein BC938DRAFT_477519 [Jimgerdemannia flammicorona]|uniref:Uncharacterized protein n=1 Tax=Jimgerdemannia flammicorona TaxID=994334 RepID=A0A433P9G7_9FUNG|nr:hypothetical protein BC938DRAFT_477519 [Jimgerdemannia flammicorona]
MALPKHLATRFTPAEIEFLAENLVISIIPSYKMDPIHLLAVCLFPPDPKEPQQILRSNNSSSTPKPQGTYGPFFPPLKVDVPLWLALTLKKNQKCAIVPPEWMSIAPRRRDRRQLLRPPLPLHGNRPPPPRRVRPPPLYPSSPRFQFNLTNPSFPSPLSALEDIPSADRVRKLLKDLRETRQSKAREGLTRLTASYLQMANLSLMEINEIRPFFVRAFNEMHSLRFEEEPEEPEEAAGAGVMRSDIVARMRNETPGSSYAKY